VERAEATTGQAAETDNSMLGAMKAAKASIEQLTAEVATLKQDNERLQNELTATTEKQQLQNELPTELGNLEAIRDRVLSNWKVSKRAESKERIKDALDKFIQQLRGTVHTLGEQKPVTETTLGSRSWESRADDFLREVAANG
jgi:predicted RNase H-like nuclease (RuvC/YqgF family)